MKDLNSVKNQLMILDALFDIFQETDTCQKDDEMMNLCGEVIGSINNLIDHIDEVITKEALIYSED